MCLPIRLPAHVFFTIMKFHNNEIHNNERTPTRFTLLLLYLYQAMLHLYNSNTSVTTYILIIPCYTPVTLLLHPCKTFAVSSFHHPHCGIFSVFDIVAVYPVAFCPDTVTKYVS